MDTTTQAILELLPQTPVIALLVWMVIEERREKRRALQKLEQCEEQRVAEAQGKKA